MRTLRRLLALGGSAALTIGFIVIGTGSAHAADQATVSILHGIPGATVDVYANGKALLKNSKPGTLTDPQMLPAGSYDLTGVKAGDGADGDAVVEANNVKVPGGASITVVAHLTTKAKPALTPYVNDVSTIPAGKARVIVRHDTAAPAVDVRADKEPVFTDLTNPKQQSAEVDAGTIKADVVLAGTDKVAIGPASLKLSEGTTTIVYAWGSAEDDNLKLAVQTIRGMHGTPNGVPGGMGAQAAAQAGGPVAAAVLGLAIVGIAISGSRLPKRLVTIAR